MPSTGNCVRAERSGGLEDLSIWTGSSVSKKILKHKIRDSSLKKLKKKEQEKMMKKLFLEGYSKNAIAEAFECLPETVTARIKRAEEDTNGT